MKSHGVTDLSPAAEGPVFMPLAPRNAVHFVHPALLCLIQPHFPSNLWIILALIVGLFACSFLFIFYLFDAYG